VHTSMKIGPQAPALFELPDGCDSSCPSSSSRSRSSV
jgi:hypothetical protein